MAFSGKMHTNT